MTPDQMTDEELLVQYFERRKTPGDSHAYVLQQEIFRRLSDHTPKPSIEVQDTGDGEPWKPMKVMIRRCTTEYIFDTLDHPSPASPPRAFRVWVPEEDVDKLERRVKRLEESLRRILDTTSSLRVDMTQRGVFDYIKAREDGRKVLTEGVL